MQQNLETFLAEAAARDRCVPGFVEREFRFSWNVACSAMASAAFAAKTVAMISLSHSRVSRGGSVRHAAGVAWRTLPLVVDRVLPEVPTRQWVLTLPIPLRYRIS